VTTAGEVDNYMVAIPCILATEEWLVAEMELCH